MNDTEASMDVDPAKRDESVDFHRFGTAGDLYVIPSDVVEYVASGAVDAELFNIPGLVRQDLDDATVAPGSPGPTTPA